MSRQIWIALLLALGTSLCAFGQDTTNWVGGATPAGFYCYGGGVSNCSSYAGGTNTDDLNGSGIDISTLGDPDAIISAAIKDGALYFTSGAYNGGGTTWSWAGGGSLEITGCIAGVAGAALSDCTGDSASNPVLLEDSFTSVTLTTSGGVPEYVFGGLQGNLSSALVTYLNSLGGSVSAAFGGPGSTATLDVVTVTATPGNAFATTSTDTQSLDTAPVPEDWNLASTLGLFGFGMVAFVIARRFSLIKPLTF